MKKFSMGAASVALALALGIASAAPVVYAAGKVDCDKVMEELNSGKKAKEVAKDLSISASSVYRCKKKAKAAEKAGASAGNTTAASPAASPAASTGASH
jgi:FixJ family two-component response regulator